MSYSCTALLDLINTVSTLLDDENGWTLEELLRDRR